MPPPPPYPLLIQSYLDPSVSYSVLSSYPPSTLRQFLLLLLSSPHQTFLPPQFPLTTSLLYTRENYNPLNSVYIDFKHLNMNRQKTIKHLIKKYIELGSEQKKEGEMVLTLLNKQHEEAENTTSRLREVKPSIETSKRILSHDLTLTSHDISMLKKRKILKSDSPTDSPVPPEPQQTSSSSSSTSEILLSIKESLTLAGKYPSSTSTTATTHLLHTHILSSPSILPFLPYLPESILSALTVKIITSNLPHTILNSFSNLFISNLTSESSSSSVGISRVYVDALKSILTFDSILGIYILTSLIKIGDKRLYEFVLRVMKTCEIDWGCLLRELIRCEIKILEDNSTIYTLIIDSITTESLSDHISSLISTLEIGLKDLKKSVKFSKLLKIIVKKHSSILRECKEDLQRIGEGVESFMKKSILLDLKKIK